MKKILVTGATGFIGRHVIAHLLHTGNKIVASSTSVERARQMPWFDRVEFIPLDLGSLEAGNDYYEFFGSPDLLIHLAWSGLPNYKSPIHLDINLPLQSAFLENLIRHGLKDLTVTGTCFEYGMREGMLSEDMDVNPTNPYGRAKHALHQFLDGLKPSIPFESKWIRLFYIYGLGQNPNSLPAQLESAMAKKEKVFNMSGGQQVRDYLPIDAAAEYIVRIAVQHDVLGVINCCSAAPVTIEKFVRDYIRKKNAEISLNLGYFPYPDYEPMSFWGDNHKLKKVLDGEKQSNC